MRRSTLLHVLIISIFSLVLFTCPFVSAQSHQLADDQQILESSRRLGWEWVNKGNEAFKKGDYNGAVKEYNAALIIFKTMGPINAVISCLNNIGLAYEALRNHPKALEYYEQELVVLRQIGDTKNIGQVINTIGSMHYLLGHYSKAITYYEQSLEIHKKTGDKDGIKACLKSIGVIHNKLGNYPETLKYYEQFLEISKTTGDKKDVGSCLMNIGMVYHSLYNNTKALERLEQSLNIYREIGDEDGVGNCLSHFGLVYKDLGNYSKSLEYYEQSLEISKAKRDKKGIGTCLVGIGAVYQFYCDYSKALAYYEQSLTNYREIGDKDGMAMCLHNIGVIYTDLSDYSRALKNIEQSLDIYRSIGSRSGAMNCLASIGLVYEALGNYSKELEYLEQSLNISREIGDKRSEARCLTNIGNVYSILGDYHEQLEYLERSLKIQREIESKEGLGIVLNNIASTYGSLGDDQKELAYIEQALEIRRKIGDTKGEIFTLHGLGITYRDNGDYEKALSIFEKINSTAAIGSVYNKMGDFKKAFACYEKFLKYHLETGDQRMLIDAYVGIGESYEGLGKSREAVASYISAVDMVENLRSGIKNDKHKTGFLSTTVQPYKKLISVLARLHLEGEEINDDDILKALGNIGEISFHIAEKIKARSLVEILAGRMGTGRTYKLPTTLIEKEQSLTHQIAKLNEQLEDAFKKDKELFEKKKERLNSLEVEQEQFIYEIRKNYPRYAAFKYPQPLSIKDIPITPNEILLEYHVSEEATYLFVVGQDKQKQNKLIKLIEVPISGEALKEKVKAFRHAFEDIRYLSEFNPMKAKELYYLLLAEGVKDLPVGSHLIIIPDGILNLLPFEALVVNTDNMKENNIGDDGTEIQGYTGIEYFGDKWPTSYYQSATVMGLNRTLGEKEQKWTKPLFALGDPVYDKEDNRYVNYTEGKQKEIKLASLNTVSPIRLRNIIREKGYMFQRLEDTRDEVLQIGRTLEVNNPLHIKLDMEANEANVKGTDLSGYRYIHFATHGILENDIPYIQEPALVLNLVNNENGEDGYLTMSEIMDLELSADMVALSACNTGLGGDIGGEGVVGLTRAFMYSGSPSVIVSLWSVSSRTTTDFMTSMYIYLKEGKNKAEAIRLARMAVRKKNYRMDVERGIGGIIVSEGMTQKSNRVIDTSHPYFWSPFILVGEREVDSSKNYEFIKEEVSTTEMSVSDKQGKLEDKPEPPNVSIKSTQPIPKDNISISKEKPVDGDSTLTKEKVLQKLGKPDSTNKWSATERWSYGTSYVEFENGVFIRCYEPHDKDDLRKKLK